MRDASIKFLGNLRVGEKIGFGFGFVGILFLIVVWQYHVTLGQLLSGYDKLHEIHAAKKSHTLMIGWNIAQAQRAQEDFLLHRHPITIGQVEHHIKKVLQHVTQLTEIDENGPQTGQKIADSVKQYHTKFTKVVTAWQKKGVNHNMGLQGQFRNTAHSLEALAAQFKGTPLLLQLLQIRRTEKNLELQHQQQYHEHVLLLLNRFKDNLAHSGLTTEVQTSISNEIDIYRQTFEIFSQEVLEDRKITISKAQFREAANRIEDMLQAHTVIDVSHDILQLRRREKDYLLRGEKKYVVWALREIAGIRKNINNSMISATDKAHFLALTEAYQRDFSALVEQNNIIKILLNEMWQAIGKINSLIDTNIAQANLAMSQVTQDTNANARNNTYWMLCLVLFTTLLSIFFAIIITLRITRPLNRIWISLSQLALGDRAERIPFLGGRNEVDVMAGAVNTLADNMDRLFSWYAASIRVDDATIRHTALTMQTNPEIVAQAEADLRQSKKAKNALRSLMHQEINTLMDGIFNQVEKLNESRVTKKKRQCMNTIRQSGETLLDIVDTIAGMSRTEMEKMKLEAETFSLPQLLDNLTKFFTEYARQKGIEFSVELDPNTPHLLTGDASHIRQIVVNLLSNAVKYTEEGSVKLKVEATPSTLDHVEIVLKVHDTGVGMNTEHIEHIFEPLLANGDYQRHKHPRTSQGLFITYKLVKLMHGSIKVDSHPGEGSTFSVTVPFLIASTVRT